MDYNYYLPDHDDQFHYERPDVDSSDQPCLHLTQEHILNLGTHTCLDCGEKLSTDMAADSSTGNQWSGAGGRTAGRASTTAREMLKDLKPVVRASEPVVKRLPKPKEKAIKVKNDMIKPPKPPKVKIKVERVKKSGKVTSTHESGTTSMPTPNPTKTKVKSSVKKVEGENEATTTSKRVKTKTTVTTPIPTPSETVVQTDPNVSQPVLSTVQSTIPKPSKASKVKNKPVKPVSEVTSNSVSGKTSRTTPPPKPVNPNPPKSKSIPVRHPVAPPRLLPLPPTVNITASVHLEADRLFRSLGRSVGKPQRGHTRLAFACVFTACERLGVARSGSQLAQQFGIPQSDVTKGLGEFNSQYSVDERQQISQLDVESELRKLVPERYPDESTETLEMLLELLNQHLSRDSPMFLTSDVVQQGRHRLALGLMHYWDCYLESQNQPVVANTELVSADDVYAVAYEVDRCMKSGLFAQNKVSKAGTGAGG